jgi:ribonuclease HI
LNKLLLFTDGSVHVQSKIGYGAFLFIPEIELPFDEIKSRVKIVRFEPTTSTKLELQTLLAALKEIQDFDSEIVVYTDSNNIFGLPGRRGRLEKNNYHSNSNQILNNADLYSDFFEVTDRLKISFVKVKGHKSTKQKDNTDLIFTLVDRASRSALRNEIRDSEFTAC